MASRFDAIMMNVAPDAKVKMFMEIEVGRYEPLSMAQFLARVNIPKMLQKRCRLGQGPIQLHRPRNLPRDCPRHH